MRRTRAQHSGWKALVILISLSAIVATALSVVMCAPAASAAVVCPTVDPGTYAVTPAPSAGVDWSGCDLSYANLASADLAGANLANAILFHANMYRVSVIGANLSGANLNQANLYQAAMASANMANASMVDSNPYYAGMTGVNLANANLAGAYLNFANLTAANLAGANLTGSYVYNTILTNANLTNSVFATHTNNTNFSGTNLTGADLTNADLLATDLTGAFITCSDSGIIGTNVYHSSVQLPSGWAIGGAQYGTFTVPVVKCPAPDLTMWMQAIGRDSSAASCSDGYTPSWDYWPNGGTGGFVCNRFIRAFGSAG